MSKFAGNCEHLPIARVHDNSEMSRTQNILLISIAIKNSIIKQSSALWNLKVFKTS